MDPHVIITHQIPDLASELNIASIRAESIARLMTGQPDWAPHPVTTADLQRDLIKLAEKLARLARMAAPAQGPASGPH